MTRIDRIQLSYDLIFTTPFHCGTGLSSGLIDRTIVRDHDGYSYVPGSTIKGLLREHCEHLSRLYEELDMFDLIASPHDEKKALLAMGQPITMVTRIFGARHCPGHLFFNDARQTTGDKQKYDSKDKEKYKNLQTSLYTQVRLDRPTRTAIPGALYTSEFGTKNLAFQGKIDGWLECTMIEGVEGEPTYSLLLLLAGLHLIDHIGGNKSTGKGQCRCKLQELKINGNLYEKERWESWLDHLDALSYYSIDGATQEEDE